MMRTGCTVFGRNVSRIHMVGIGGMGMAPLAVFLAQRGFRVSGGDARIPGFTEKLFLKNKIEVTHGELPDGVDLVVRSSAISLRHHLLQEARGRGIPVCRRGEMLAEAVRDRKLIAVVGSHGKTTSCGMLIAAMGELGFEFGYVLGGLFQDESISPAAFSRDSEWVLAEIDESDGTIDCFSPEVSIVVNIDWDHCDRYSEEEVLMETFSALFQRTAGAVFIHEGCSRSKRVAKTMSHCAVHTFGENGEYGCRLEDDRRGMSLLSLKGKWKEQTVLVRASGRFNAGNACAAMAVCHYLASLRSDGEKGFISFPENLLAAFPGIRRRQGLLFDSPSLTIVEDYAHHPAEIAAFLECMANRWPDRRLVVVFQPHRYTRTRQFKKEFAAVLEATHRLFLLDVYPAAEAPVEGGRGTDLYREIQRRLAPGTATFFQNKENVEVEIAASLEPGDLLLFVGAGDIEDLALRFVDRVKRPVFSPSGNEEELSPEVSAEAGGKDTSGILLRQHGFDRDRGAAVAASFAGGATRWGNGPFARLSEFAVSRENEPLAKKTTLRVGGDALYYAEPASEEDLEVLLRDAKEWGLQVHLLGRGSNVIVPDEGISGLVIRLQSPFWRQLSPFADGRLWAGGGLRLRTLCGEACKEGWGGLEFLEGIPGTVGGALRMNAGAMGGCFFDVVEEVHVMSLDGTKTILSKGEVRHGYRECADLLDAVALGAVLAAPWHGANGDIQRRMVEFQDHRISSQPREASAGCTFRNPAGGSAGRVIEELGLKGKRIGDAEVSEVHGNFIVNRGAATSDDVVALIRFVRDEVDRRRGILLEPEVLFLGKRWEDIL